MRKYGGTVLCVVGTKYLVIVACLALNPFSVITFFLCYNCSATTLQQVGIFLVKNESVIGKVVNIVLSQQG